MKQTFGFSSLSPLLVVLDHQEEYSFCPFPTSATAFGRNGSRNPSDPEEFFLFTALNAASRAWHGGVLFKKKKQKLDCASVAVILPDWMGEMKSVYPSKSFKKPCRKQESLSCDCHSFIFLWVFSAWVRAAFNYFGFLKNCHSDCVFVFYAVRVVVDYLACPSSQLHIYCA